MIINMVIDIIMVYKYKKLMEVKARISRTLQNSQTNFISSKKLLRIILSFGLIHFFSAFTRNCYILYNQILPMVCFF